MHRANDLPRYSLAAASRDPCSVNICTFRMLSTCVFGRDKDMLSAG